MDRFARQGKRINAIGAMAAASMAAAANIDTPNCSNWRNCIGHGSLAVGIGHLESEVAGAMMYSQPLPVGTISLGISVADGDVASSLGMGFKF